MIEAACQCLRLKTFTTKLQKAIKQNVCTDDYAMAGGILKGLAIHLSKPTFVLSQ